jgi:polyisoprenoid-binding protein YceI
MTKLFLALLFASAALGATFEVDPAKTEIHYILPATLHTVHGTFKLKRGSISFELPAGKASGEIVIDATSGDSGNGSRDKRMHKEILETERYPEAVFVPDSVQGRLETEGESLIDVHGVFKIHGADHEMTLNLRIDAQGGGHYLAATHFTIPYVKWGIKNPSNFFVRVNDTVAVDIKASAVARPPH